MVACTNCYHVLIAWLIDSAYTGKCVGTVYLYSILIAHQVAGKFRMDCEDSLVTLEIFLAYTTLSP